MRIVGGKYVLIKRLMLFAPIVTIILFSGELFAGDKTRGELYEEGERSGRILSETYGKDIGKSIFAPMLSDEGANVLDGKSPGSSENKGPTLNCENSYKFLTIKFDSIGYAGDIERIIIGYDKNLDNKIDVYSEEIIISKTISGICSNGYYSCRRGKQELCHYYEWVSGSDGSIAWLPYTNRSEESNGAGNCYCINDSCKSPGGPKVLLAPGVLEKALRDIGQGIFKNVVMANSINIASSRNEIVLDERYAAFSAVDSSSCGRSHLPSDKKIEYEKYAESVSWNKIDKDVKSKSGGDYLAEKSKEEKRNQEQKRSSPSSIAFSQSGKAKEYSKKPSKIKSAITEFEESLEIDDDKSFPPEKQSKYSATSDSFIAKKSTAEKIKDPGRLSDRVVKELPNPQQGWNIGEAKEVTNNTDTNSVTGSGKEAKLDTGSPNKKISYKYGGKENSISLYAGNDTAKGCIRSCVVGIQIDDRQSFPGVGWAGDFTTSIYSEKVNGHRFKFTSTDAINRECIPKGQCDPTTTSRAYKCDINDANYETFFQCKDLCVESCNSEPANYQEYECFTTKSRYSDRKICETDCKTMCDVIDVRKQYRCPQSNKAYSQKNICKEQCYGACQVADIEPAYMCERDKKIYDSWFGCINSCEGGCPLDKQNGETILKDCRCENGFVEAVSASSEQQALKLSPPICSSGVRQ